MTNNIDRAADIINRFCCGYCEHFGQEQAHALADAGLLAPDLSTVTRITVAGDGKRQMEEWNLRDVELHIQDEGRTLKIFYRTNIQEKDRAADHAEEADRADA